MPELRTNLTIDPQRLWDQLMETAKFGGTAKGGIKRLTLTDDDRQVRDWFKALYETLLGSAQGPRMGSFIALYGVANTRKLIAEALGEAG